MQSLEKEWSGWERMLLYKLRVPFSINGEVRVCMFSQMFYIHLLR